MCFRLIQLQFTFVWTFSVLRCQIRKARLWKVTCLVCRKRRSQLIFRPLVFVLGDFRECCLWNENVISVLFVSAARPAPSSLQATSPLSLPTRLAARLTLKTTPLFVYLFVSRFFSLACKAFCEAFCGIRKLERENILSSSPLFRFHKKHASNTYNCCENAVFFFILQNIRFSSSLHKSEPTGISAHDAGNSSPGT